MSFASILVQQNTTTAGGSPPNPDEGAYSAVADTLAGFKRDRKERKKGRETVRERGGEVD